MLSRAINLDSKRASLYFFRGNILVRTQKNEEAIVDYLFAISLRPNLSGAHNNLAMTYVKVGQLEKACESFKKAIELGDEKAVENLSKYCTK